MFSNPSCEMLITDSVSNQTELTAISTHIAKGEKVADVVTASTMHKSDENTRITDSLLNCNAAGWDEPTKMKALLAARYLNSLSKGGNALEIAAKLEDNLQSQTPISFVVPTYLKDAIIWSCQ